MDKTPNTDEYKTLSITMTDGEIVEFTGDRWDDYTIALGAPVPCAVVKLRGAWIGVFPLAHVKHVIMS